MTKYFNNSIKIAFIAVFAMTAAFAVIPTTTDALGTSGCGGCGGGDYGGDGYGDYGGGDIGDPSYGGWGGHDGDYNDGNDPSHTETPYVPPYIPPVVYPAPTCTLSTSLSTITEGGSAVLSLSSANATSASINYSIGAVGISSYTTVTPSTSRTYTATVVGLGGSAICSTGITVTQVQHAPTCTLSASPSSIAHGGNTTLTWSSTYTSDADINHGVGTVGTTGSYGVSGLTSDRTYTMTVTGTGGSATCSAAINVASQPVQTNPTCDVWASPRSVSYNDSTTLHWSSSDATSMYVSGVGYVSSNTSDSRTFYNLTSDRTFTCTARDADGDEDTDSTRVTVSGQQHDNPTCTLYASPSSVQSGGNSTLSWSTTNAYSASLSSVGTVPVNGSQTMYNLYSTKTYTLTVQGYGGSTSCTRTVGVYSQPEPPRPVYPTCQIYVSPSTVPQGSGATISWTAQNATGATLTNIGTVSAYSGTKFVNPGVSKTYTLTVFNNSGYRASCSTHLTVAPQVITHYQPAQYVALTSVPYTGAEDYIYPAFLLTIVLTAGYVMFTQRRRIFLGL